jgi:hypothetical protein
MNPDRLPLRSHSDPFLSAPRISFSKASHSEGATADRLRFSILDFEPQDALGNLERLSAM